MSRENPKIFKKNSEKLWKSETFQGILECLGNQKLHKSKQFRKIKKISEIQNNVRKSKKLRRGELRILVHSLMTIRMTIMMIILDRDEKDAVDPEKLRFKASLSLIIIHPDVHCHYPHHHPPWCIYIHIYGHYPHHHHHQHPRQYYHHALSNP